MTDAFSPAFQIAPLAISEAPASSGGSSSGGGAGLGHRIDTDWSATRRDGEAKVRQERRSAVERARHSVEAGWSRPGQVSKQERLRAAASKGKRDTGSPKERNAVKSAVQKAIERVSGVPSDTEISDDNARAVREVFRQRYPGRELSDMIKNAEETEKQFQNDPVAARDVLVARYAKMPAENLPTFKARQYSDGLRGSIQRAQQDQADAEDLAEASAKYGKGLNTILAQLEAFDTGMLTNPGLTSARLAAAYGAPSVEAEIEPYKAKQAAKAQVAHTERMQNNRIKGVQMAIQHGMIPGDEESLEEIAAVLVSPHFQKHPNDGLDSLRRAAAIVTHPQHEWKTGKRAAKRREAGTKSIGGGSPSAGHIEPRTSRSPGSGGVRDSIDRAFGA